MKSSFAVRVLRSLALVVAAIVLAPQLAHADSSACGEFTLKSPAQWGALYMPAGTYTYTVDYRGSYTMILVADLSGKTLGYVIPSSTATDPAIQTTTIQLDSVGAKSFITSMKVSDLGLEFTFSRPAAAKAEFAYKGASPQTTAFAAAK